MKKMEITRNDRTLISERNYFLSSFSLSEHPLSGNKEKINVYYYTLLKYFAYRFVDDSCKQYVVKRLGEYKTMLLQNIADYPEITTEDAIDYIFANFRPWRKKFRFWFLCDLALLTLYNYDAIVANCIQSFPQKRQKILNKALGMLKNAIEATEEHKYSMPVKQILWEYNQNRAFIEEKETRLLITANMSAGKSTLINAIVGKPVARSAMAACTGNICYIHNKAFDDNRVYLKNEDICLDAGQNELSGFSWNRETDIAIYFKSLSGQHRKLCIIDTPGVNSAVNTQHRGFTRDTISLGQFDKLIYMFNACKLGTTEEIDHIKWISEKVPHQKVIFVLNQVDRFVPAEDSIVKSIEALKSDLSKAGFEDAVICPLSAYFGQLIKMKMHGIKLSEDELEEYEMLVKRFNRDFHNLSAFYEGVVCNATDSIELSLSKKSGLFGLEKIIYGG